MFWVANCGPALSPSARYALRLHTYWRIIYKVRLFLLLLCILGPPTGCLKTLPCMCDTDSPDTSFENAKKTTCLSIKSVHMSQPTSFSLLLDSFCLHSHYLSISLVCVSSRFLFQQKQPRSIDYRHARLLMRGCTIHSNGPLLVV